jgi:lipopolysaccharide transport system permease protein
MGWAILQPVFSMVIFTIVFGKLARISSDGVPYALFSFAALVPWTFFANALQDATASLIGNASMLSKVYFPRMTLPLSAVAAKLVDFSIALIILLIMQAFYGLYPNRQILVLPLLILIMVAAAAGAGMWLASLAIRYRDVAYSMGFLVQLLMYCAPVVYPSSLIPSKYQMIYSLNPMVAVIEGFRAALLGTHDLNWPQIGIGFLSALAIAVSGAFYFRGRERFFADVA